MYIRARAQAIFGALLAAVLVVTGSVGLSAQDKKDEKKNQPKYTKEQIADAQALMAVVDAVAAGKQPAPADVPVTFQSHFMRSREGKTFMPFTIAFDQSAFTSPNVLLYVRAVKRGAAEAPAAPADTKDKDKDKAKNGRPEYSWEEHSFINLKANPPAAGSPYRISRYIGVTPGEYDLYVALRERPANEKEKRDKNAPPLKTTILKQPVTAPDFNNGLAVSSLIVVQKVEDLAAPMTDEAQLKENPYTFGTMKLTPALSNKFTKKDEISWIFVIYNAQLDATSKKPDVAVEYNFYQKTKDGEKYFNKTSPQSFNATTLPPQWDGAVSNQISAGQSVPLASFPEGEYRLEVKVTDKLATKTLTDSVPFSVIAGS